MNIQSSREAPDDEWGAERRSGFMSWLRRRFRIFGGVAGAVSYADTGPYAGAPRDPNLRVDDERQYSTVRYTTNHIAHIATSTTEHACPKCGSPIAETHEIQHRQGDDIRLRMGAVSACRVCEPNSWLLQSQMTAASRTRDARRKNTT
jgi:predicted RNA-binding Zn-ribbon protein involved in translation (DUF1610 family)